MSNNSDESKNSTTAILGLLFAGLLGAVVFLIFSDPEANAIGSGMMDDDEPIEQVAAPITEDTDSKDGNFPTAEIGTTEGLKFRATGTELIAIGTADAETKTAIDQILAASYGTQVQNLIEIDDEIEPAKYTPQLISLLQLMSTSAQNAELEVTDEKVTLTGTVPNEPFKASFDQALDPSNGWPEIENNLTLHDTGVFSEFRATNKDGLTSVNAIVGTQEVKSIIETSAVEIFGDEVELDITVDETRMTAFTWSRWPEFMGGFSLFENWEAAVTNTGGAESFLAEGLNFDSASSQLTPASAERVRGVLPFLLATVSPIAVTGHTDSDGEADINQVLSESRAAVVAEVLQLAATEQGFGAVVPAERFVVAGAGEDQPLADNATDAGKAKNRRVEVSLVVSGDN